MIGEGGLESIKDHLGFPIYPSLVLAMHRAPIPHLSFPQGKLLGDRKRKKERKKKTPFLGMLRIENLRFGVFHPGHHVISNSSYLMFTSRIGSGGKAFLSVQGDVSGDGIHKNNNNSTYYARIE